MRCRKSSRSWQRNGKRTRQPVFLRMNRIHSLRLSVNEFNVTSGNSTPREILCVRQPASLRQGSAMVLFFQNTDQHITHFSSLQGKCCHGATAPHGKGSTIPVRRTL